jgi:hypothetical protein
VALPRRRLFWRLVRGGNGRGCFRKGKSFNAFFGLSLAQRQSVFSGRAAAAGSRARSQGEIGKLAGSTSCRGDMERHGARLIAAALCGSLWALEERNRILLDVAAFPCSHGNVTCRLVSEKRRQPKRCCRSGLLVACLKNLRSERRQAD